MPVLAFFINKDICDRNMLSPLKAISLSSLKSKRPFLSSPVGNCSALVGRHG
jgi:hypothetical protein